MLRCWFGLLDARKIIVNRFGGCDDDRFTFEQSGERWVVCGRNMYMNTFALRQDQEKLNKRAA